MSIFDWFIDSLASKEVVDSYFILSDMKDIDLIESEQMESAHFDSLANQISDNAGDSDVPLGKQVW